MTHRNLSQHGGGQHAAVGAPSCPSVRNGWGRRRLYRDVVSLLAILAGLLAGARAEPPGAWRGIVPLIAARSFDLREMDSLCAGLPLPCSAGDTRVYNEGKAADGALWLIDAARPALTRWVRATGKAEQWDFSGYRHSYAEGGEQPGAEPLIIHPALYPARGDGFSVALVREYREMYSGGGASYGIADFVEVGPGGSVGTLIYGAVPFACRKMIRACFSERDYRTSKHCHDEYSGYLTIDTAAGAEWQFTWHETAWPANTAAGARVKSRTRFRLEQGAPPASATLPEGPAFCNGPQ